MSDLPSPRTPIEQDGDPQFNWYQYFQALAESRLKQGAGNPNGVVEGNTYSRYLDTAAAPGANYYVKTTDSGNTGWQLV